MKSKRWSASSWALCAGIIAGAAASPAVAQQVEKSADAVVEAANEVIVTATKRAEPLQQVPIAITVLTGDQMRVGNLNGLRDIANFVPAFNVRQAASFKDQALFLRGLGTSSTSPGVEPSVSTVIDGVVLGRQGQASIDLLDVDHVEVLRGPQGTLFGKNASAGVMNIITKDPGQTVRGYAEASSFEGNEWRLRGSVSGPVSETIGASLSLLDAHYDGNVSNAFDGSVVNGYDTYGIRSKWVWKASDSLRLQLTGDVMHMKNTSPNGVVSRASKIAYPTNVVSSFPTFAAAYVPAQIGDESRQININWQTYAKDDASGVALQADKAFGDFTVTSITAVRSWENLQLQDQDKLPQAVIGFPQQHDRGTLRYDQFSQELRLTSPKAQFFDYVLGLYYFEGTDKEHYQRDVTNKTSSATTLNTGVADFGVTNTSYAVFGEGNVHFTPRFRGIVGVRGTHDDVKYNFARTSTSAVAVTGIQAPFSSAGSTSAEEVSSRLGVQYDVAPKSMAYFTYSRGYKGPAYNLAFSMLPQDALALKPELSDAFELGLKSQLLGDRLTLNLAAFSDDVENFQVPFFDVFNGSQITRLVNAGAVSTRGVEADFLARPTDRLTLSGSLGYTDAKIDSFKCPVGAATSCQVNGKPLTFAPDWKGVLRAEYLFDLTSAWDLKLGADVTYRGETQYSINQFPDTIEPSFTLWNAHATLVSNEGLEVNLIARNIGDQSYSPYLQQFGQGVVRFVPRDDRRYVGIDVRKAF